MTEVELPWHRRLWQIAEEAGLVCCDVEFGTSAQRFRFQYCSEDFEATSPARLAGRFLIASITKPIVAMAVMKLVAEGRLSLSERVSDLFPEFRRADVRRILVRHLLTHTSGLPDMLPNNAELRSSHASLEQFLAETFQVDLDFPVATDCRYSSMGFLILGAIIEKLTQQKLADYLQHTFFRPLNMPDSWLGFSESEAEQLMPTVFPCILPDWQQAEDRTAADHWGWNSRYWRTLGAPWGGMISTSADLGNFAQLILGEGQLPDGSLLLPPDAVRVAIQNQSAEIVSGSIAPRPWGLGWRRQWAAHPASFGDLVGENTVGHWGATGTLLWIDPDHDRYAVILTTTPYEYSQSVIQRISNLVCGVLTTDQQPDATP